MIERICSLSERFPIIVHFFLISAPLFRKADELNNCIKTSRSLSSFRNEKLFILNGEQYCQGGGYKQVIFSDRPIRVF